LLKWDIKYNSGHENIFSQRGRDEVRIGWYWSRIYADKIKALLISKGVVAGIVNVSGDINTWENINGEKWKV
jgi:thiamine biosynthesis lipoprotein